jgi:hypothetical protein
MSIEGDLYEIRHSITLEAEKGQISAWRKQGPFFFSLHLVEQLAQKAIALGWSQLSERQYQQGCYYIWEGVCEQHLIWPICRHPGDFSVWYLGEDIIKSKLSESYQLRYELTSKRCQEFWDWGLRSYLSFCAGSFKSLHVLQNQI